MDNDTGQYVFPYYVDKIVNEYDTGKIPIDKAEKLFNTLQRWEMQFFKLPVAKQNQLYPLYRLIK